VIEAWDEAFGAVNARMEMVRNGVSVLPTAMCEVRSGVDEIWGDEGGCGEVIRCLERVILSDR